MKPLILAAALVVSAGMARAADPVLGRWKTQGDNGAYAHVKVAACGVIARTFNDTGEHKFPKIGKS